MPLRARNRKTKGMILIDVHIDMYLQAYRAYV